MSLDELRDDSPLELPSGVEVEVLFSGVRLKRLTDGAEALLRGPVDLAAYGLRKMTFTPAEGGPKREGEGLTLTVSSLDGEAVDDRPLNILSKRLILSLREDLASGAYMRTRYFITKIGEPPLTTYQVRREPLPPST